jgi:hypothetical protein
MIVTFFIYYSIMRHGDALLLTSDTTLEQTRDKLLHCLPAFSVESNQFPSRDNQCPSTHRQ